MGIGTMHLLGERTPEKLITTTEKRRRYVRLLIPSARRPEGPQLTRELTLRILLADATLDALRYGFDQFVHRFATVAVPDQGMPPQESS